MDRAAKWCEEGARRVRRQSIERGWGGEKARCFAGGKKNELIRKQFEVEQQKNGKTQKADWCCNNSEDNVVSCILKHENNVLDAQKSATRQSIGMRGSAQTEQIHAFDDLTKTLNEGRNINCDLSKQLRMEKSKTSAGEPPRRNNKELVEYDKDEDEERMSWVRLQIKRIAVSMERQQHIVAPNNRFRFSW